MTSLFCPMIRRNLLNLLFKPAVRTQNSSRISFQPREVASYLSYTESREQAKRLRPKPLVKIFVVRFSSSRYLTLAPIRPMSKFDLEIFFERLKNGTRSFFST